MSREGSFMELERIYDDLEKYLAKRSSNLPRPPMAVCAGYEM